MTRQIQPINTILRPDGTVDVPAQPTCRLSLAVDQPGLSSSGFQCFFDTISFESPAGMGDLVTDQIHLPEKGVYLVSALIMSTWHNLDATGEIPFASIELQASPDGVTWTRLGVTALRVPSFLTGPVEFAMPAGSLVTTLYADPTIPSGFDRVRGFYNRFSGESTTLTATNSLTATRLTPLE